MTTPDNTASKNQTRGRSLTIEPPPLARYLQLTSYKPTIGDFVVWAGWFRTWYGVVANVESDGEMIHLIFEGLPSLLFTMTAEEQQKNTHKITLSSIRAAKFGCWSIMQHDAQRNASIWYI